jgi:cytochrome c biogenesis protein CcdA/thiol-disulfide isomerase/thioredoxin
MLLLMVFALVAGAGTAITPCVLPVLPALLSASVAGGRRRPLGIVLGLAVTFTVAIVALAQLVNGVGLAGGAARTVAIVVLVAFGLVLLLPGVAQRVQAPLSRLARFGPRTRGTGFWSGLGVGGALGFVCAPCAGPILAAVTSVSASGGASARVVAVAVAYAVGLSAVLLLYGLGGRAVLARVRRTARGDVVERTLGVVLLVTAVVMATNLDVRFEDALARNTSLPGFLVDPTRALENSHAVQSRLTSLRPASRFAERQRQEAAVTPVATHTGVTIPGVKTPPLPQLGLAPAFRNTQRWFNTPGGRPLALAQMRGHVVLVDFWTYTCINCIRTLPFLKGLYATYHRAGLDIVGVETPEFTFEQDPGNVAEAVKNDGLRYPVVQDNRYGTWNAYQNEYWPAEYLIDARGQLRHTQFGEGDYKQDEAAVRELLYEAGARRLPEPMGAHAILPSQGLATPETYLDSQRSQGFAQPLQAGTRFYPGVIDPQINEFGLHGTWKVSSESSTPTSAGAYVIGRFQAAHV